MHGTPSLPSPISKSEMGEGKKQYSECKILLSSNPLFPFPHSCTSEWGKDGMGVCLLHSSVSVSVFFGGGGGGGGGVFGGITFWGGGFVLASPGRPFETLLV